MSILMDIGRLLSGIVIIDDGDDSFVIFLVVFYAIIVIMGLIALAVAKASKRSSESAAMRNANIEKMSVKTEPALVIKKETDEENGMYLPIHTVLFEMNDGRRLRLRINDETVFQDIVEGQYGELRYHGKYFISFQ